VYKKIWKRTCLKEEGNIISVFSHLESFNRVQTVIANYKFSEKIKYPNHELLCSNSTGWGVQEAISSFNIIKYFAYTYYTLYIFVRSIYMFSFLQNAFSQTLSSTSSKSRCMPRILMRKYALTSIVQISEYWDRYRICISCANCDWWNRMFIPRAIVHGRRSLRGVQTSSD